MCTVVLRDLVTVWLVLVEVVLPIPTAPVLNVAVHGQCRTQCGYECGMLELRLRTRQCSIEEGDVRVRVGIRRGRSGGEELVGGIELGVDFNTHGQLPGGETSIDSLCILRALAGSFGGFLFLFGRVFQLLAQWYGFCCSIGEATSLGEVGDARRPAVGFRCNTACRL